MNPVESLRISLEDQSLILDDTSIGTINRLTGIPLIAHDQTELLVQIFETLVNQVLGFDNCAVGNNLTKCIVSLENTILSDPLCFYCYRFDFLEWIRVARSKSIDIQGVLLWEHLQTTMQTYVRRTVQNSMSFINDPKYYKPFEKDYVDALWSLGTWVDWYRE